MTPIAGAGFGAGRWPEALVTAGFVVVGLTILAATVLLLVGFVMMMIAGVALMLVSTSVMGGFGQEIRRMIIDTGGDIQIRSSAAIRCGMARVTFFSPTMPTALSCTPQSGSAMRPASYFRLVSPLSNRCWSNVTGSASGRVW